MCRKSKPAQKLGCVCVCSIFRSALVQLLEVESRGAMDVLWLEQTMRKERYDLLMKAGNPSYEIYDAKLMHCAWPKHSWLI